MYQLHKRVEEEERSYPERKMMEEKGKAEYQLENILVELRSVRSRRQK